MRKYTSVLQLIVILSNHQRKIVNMRANKITLEEIRSLILAEAILVAQSFCMVWLRFIFYITTIIACPSGPTIQTVSVKFWLSPKKESK